MGGDGGEFVPFPIAKSENARSLAKDESQPSVESPATLSTEALLVRP